MGLPLSEDFLRQHRESISTCFIESSRAGVRLPPAVPLPPLAQVNEPLKSDLSDDRQVGKTLPEPVQEVSNGNTPKAGEIICTMTQDPDLETATTNGHAPPMVIPKDAGLPCGGVVIADLKPAQLAMLVSKTAALVHAEGEAWIGLLGALQVERARRLEKGRKRPRPDLDPVGHVEVEEG
jgi:hypothetical protein